MKFLPIIATVSGIITLLGIILCWSNIPFSGFVIGLGIVTLLMSKEISKIIDSYLDKRNCCSDPSETVALKKEKEPTVPTIIERHLPEGTTTPSFYLNPDVATLALSWGKELLGRVPPIQETAKYVLLGAAQALNTKDVFVEFDAKNGDYFLYKLVTNHSIFSDE